MRVLLGLFLLAASAFGQGVFQPSRAITSGASDPAVCNPSQNIPFFRNTMSATTKFCSATNTWSAIGTGSGTGTVTSVSFTGGLISVATATTTPALTVAGTSGGVPYFSSTSTWASSGALTANLPVIGGGAGAAPTVGTRSGNTTAFVTTTGAQTSGDCVTIDASGNHVAAGAACGAGAGTSTTDQSVIRASTEDTARANLVVFNRDGGTTATVDISGFATAGQFVTIKNAQDWFGTPVYQGVYPGGSVTFSTNGTPAVPTGGTGLAADAAFFAGVIFKQTSPFVRQSIVTQ